MTTLTKDAIKQSFMKLLNQKPLSKITVKEIVEDCGIKNRSAKLPLRKLSRTAESTATLFIIITTTFRRLLRKY